MESASKVHGHFREVHQKSPTQNIWPRQDSNSKAGSLAKTLPIRYGINGEHHPAAMLRTSPASQNIKGITFLMKIAHSRQAPPADQLTDPSTRLPAEIMVAPPH